MSSTLTGKRSAKATSDSGTPSRAGRLPSGLLPHVIYESLLRSIILGEYKPGEFLLEIRLTEKFQTSRTPIREACIRLHNEGFVRAIPHKGYLVTEVRLEDAPELLQARQIVEPEAAALAAAREYTPELPPVEPERGNEFEALANHGARDELFLQVSEYEYKFHHGIAVASGNKVIAYFVGRIMRHYLRCNFPHFSRSRTWARTFQEHGRIVEAIQERDGARAREAMKEHIGLAREGYFRRIAGEQWR